MPRLIGLDFETFGEVNLPKYGLDNYINGKGFTPLIACTSEPSVGKAYDFVRYGDAARRDFEQNIRNSFNWGVLPVAHNSGFERAVLKFMNIGNESFIESMADSAVISRINGASSHLEAAAPQLTHTDKLEVGKELIALFSIPNERNHGRPFTWAEIEVDSELRFKWDQFIEYCIVDAEASYNIAKTYWNDAAEREQQLERLTYRMNQRGWKVDLPKVHEMKQRYEENTTQIVSDFMTRHNIDNEKFLNSTVQMKAWCAERGVKTTSFDAEHVERLIKRIDKALSTMNPRNPKYDDYAAVHDLLVTKRELGGSSLKKLQVILDLTSADGRLRNQYMHVGAGQSYRTTGKGVQMQNLKRLSSNMLDMDELDDPDTEIDNTTLAENLRQVFVADTPNSRLIVGDFSSVESRGLAWIAGADWKIDAYKAGKDLYKVQAAQIFHKQYEAVTKDERQTGKVGELSCGYGAGGGAVHSFAAKMGIEMSEDEALDLVRNWRTANPETVDLWDRLNEMLHQVVDRNTPITQELAHGLRLTLIPEAAPPSLQQQHPGVITVTMRLTAKLPNNVKEDRILDRTFHGLYMRGNDVCFYKPSDRKTGDLWSNHYRDPKTGKIVFYKLYGGKLTGILVQSMCRELFFDSLELLEISLQSVTNAEIIGQFHDEIVVSWREVDLSQPGQANEEHVQNLMRHAMSTVRRGFYGFPLEADIKSAFRYIK